MKKTIWLLTAVLVCVLLLLISSSAVDAPVPFKLLENQLYVYSKQAEQFGIDRQWTVYNDGKVIYEEDGKTETVTIDVSGIISFIKNEEYSKRKRMVYQALFVNEYEKEGIIITHLINKDGKTYSIQKDNRVEDVIIEAESLRES